MTLLMVASESGVIRLYAADDRTATAAYAAAVASGADAELVALTEAQWARVRAEVGSLFRIVDRRRPDNVVALDAFRNGRR